MSNFHGRLMNIPQPRGFRGEYYEGHRDARHAAAEIGLEADALAADNRRLTALVDDWHTAADLRIAEIVRLTERLAEAVERIKELEAQLANRS